MRAEALAKAGLLVPIAKPFFEINRTLWALNPYKDTGTGVWP